MEGLHSQQNSHAMECEICLNEYSWRRRAKLLACRHTCCSVCLGRMLTVRRNDLDRDQRETVTGPGGIVEQWHASQRRAPVNGVENGQRDRRRHLRLVTLRRGDRHDEPERDRIEMAIRPRTDMEQQQGVPQRQTAVSGMASGQQRDDRVTAQLTQPRRNERHNELERDQRGMVIRPSNSPQRRTGVSGTESGQRENSMVTQLTHGDLERDQRGGTAGGPCSNMEDNPQRQMGVNDVETGQRDVTLRHNEMDSGHHHHHQRDAIHHREALVGNNPVEIINTYDSGAGGMARGQTEILSSQREMMMMNRSETSTSQNVTATSWNEMRLTDQDEMMMPDPNDNSIVQSEWRTNFNDIWLGQEGTHSTYQTVVICPWCRGVTVFPDGLSVNHLPDDQDKMAAVTTTPPPTPIQQYTPVFIRLLPSSYLIPWSIDRDGNHETDGVIMPSSTHYLLPVYMERDNGVRGSVIISNASHYLLSSVRSAYFDRGRNVGDAGEPRVVLRCLLPWPATGQRQSLPGTRDSSGMGEVWREGERVGLREEEGLRERGRDQREEKRSSRLWTRVCTVIILGLFVFLLVCIVLHSMTCSSKAFTMITCG